MVTSMSIRPHRSLSLHLNRGILLFEPKDVNTKAASVGGTVGEVVLLGTAIVVDVAVHGAAWARSSGDGYYSPSRSSSTRVRMVAAAESCAGRRTTGARLPGPVHSTRSLRDAPH